jgi:hypothetical protein
MKHLHITIIFLFTLSYSLAQNEIYNSTFNLELNTELQQVLNSFHDELTKNGINESDFLNHTATAHYIYIDKGKIKSAIKDLKNNIPFNEFILQHPDTKVDSNLLVIRHQQLNFKNETVTNYTNLPGNKKYLHSITSTRKTVMPNYNFKGKWIYNYVSKTKYSDEFLMAFYFTSNFGFESLSNQFPTVIAFSNSIQKKGDLLVEKYNQETSINKIISFLEKLVDVCASIFISYNNPDLLKVALTNIIIPKMKRPTNNLR